jgi:hypothetical protein
MLDCGLRFFHGATRHDWIRRNNSAFFHKKNIPSLRRLNQAQFIVHRSTLAPEPRMPQRFNESSLPSPRDHDKWKKTRILIGRNSIE